MIQTVILWILFSAAVGYLGRMTFRAFQAKAACASGCGKCAIVDFDKLEKQIARDAGVKAGVA